ncbi:P-loop containing nucleoside triphosphate hydrolase protein [Geranomyces variabilis]|nr:P-loop containing nucleoside triphosphate hydrolase protein [Geranomyces variabilis]
MSNCHGDVLVSRCNFFVRMAPHHNHRPPHGLSTFDPTDKARILVVGDAGVGKTSLIHLLCQSTPLTSPVPTVGCSVDVSVVDHPRTKRSYFVEFIDVAAGSKHKLSRGIFYANVNALILVHDVTNKRSYQNLWKWTAEVFNSPQFRGVAAGAGAGVGGVGKDFEVDVRVGESHPTLPVLVVGTKADLAPDISRRRSSIAEEYGGDCITMSTQQNLPFVPALDRIEGFLAAVVEARMLGLSPTSTSTNALSSSYSTSSLHHGAGGGSQSHSSLSSLAHGAGGGSLQHLHFTSNSLSSSTSTSALTPEMQRRRIPQTGLYGLGGGGGGSVSGSAAFGRPASPNKAANGAYADLWGKPRSDSAGSRGGRGYR